MGKHSLREEHPDDEGEPTEQIPVTREAIAKLGKHHVKPSPRKRSAAAPEPEPFKSHKGKLNN